MAAIPGRAESNTFLNFLLVKFAGILMLPRLSGSFLKNIEQQEAAARSTTGGLKILSCKIHRQKFALLIIVYLEFNVHGVRTVKGHSHQLITFNR